MRRKIEFVEGDLFEQDLSTATVITLYLLPSLNERLRPKLFRETRPGTRIVSNAFDMGDWKADRTMTVKMNSGMQSYAYLWIMPADVSGQWRLTTQGGSANEQTLDVKQKYQEVSGTATAGGKATPLTNLTVKGDQVSFTLGEGADRVEYTGKVTDGKASGTAKGKGGSFGVERRADRTRRAARHRVGRGNLSARDQSDDGEARRRGGSGATHGRGGGAARRCRNGPCPGRAPVRATRSWHPMGWCGSSVRKGTTSPIWTRRPASSTATRSTKAPTRTIWWWRRTGWCGTPATGTGGW